MPEINEAALERNADKLRSQTSGFTGPDGDPVAFGEIDEGQYLRKVGGEIIGGNGPGSGSGAALSDATPQPTGTAGSVGVGEDSSRDTHVHPLGSHDHSGVSGHGGNIPAASVTGLSTVATTGAFGDLSGTPSIPADLSAIPFLVTTAQAGLSAEVVVGEAPGGELGGTWPSPTVDASHSGSTHAATQGAAEATAAAALSGHVAAGDPHVGYAKEADLATIATSGAVGALVPAGADKVLYVSHGNVVSELALSSTAGHALLSQGATSAPAFGVAQALLGENAPTSLSGSQNDYAFGGSAARVQRVTANAARTITGFSVSQMDGYLLQIVNTSAFVYTFPHESVSSTDVNRINTPNAQSYLLFPGMSVAFRYSGTASRWLPVCGPMMPMPFVRFTMSVMTVGNNSNTALSFDNVSAVSPFWLPAPVATLTEITMPFTGWVDVHAFDLDWGDNSTGNGLGQRLLGRRRNADITTLRMGDIKNASGNSAKSVHSIHFEVYVTAGETLAIIAKQTSGSTLTNLVAMDELVMRYTEFGGYSPSGAGGAN